MHKAINVKNKVNQNMFTKKEAMQVTRRMHHVTIHLSLDLPQCI